MKRFIFSAIATLMLISCGSDKASHQTIIEGRFVGSNVDSVFLERVSDTFVNPERIAATALAENGAFRFSFDIEESTSPRFYKLSFPDNTRPVTLVVAPGDNIRLEAAGDIFLNYTVEGSEESALIREFNNEYFASCDRLALIAETMAGSSKAIPERQAYLAARNAIQTQVRFVGTHHDKLAAFYAMRHNIAEQYIPQLNGYGITLAHYNTVLEGITKSYPDSPYIAIIEREIADAEAIHSLSNSIEYSSYPDIELEDMYKVKHRLSSLDGKVIMLYFWTAESALCNTINADMKALYERYHDAGFEVYQVSADRDVSMWIEAVRQQQLPWISLFAAGRNDVFSLYNVVKLPMAYLIDREGNMSIAPLDMKELENEIKKHI
ncbi:MAG: redoxin domain-containing protein [Alistipes sp.]|nr:redoxin domain-containing protein [Alistipes sp.]